MDFTTLIIFFSDKQLMKSIVVFFNDESSKYSDKVVFQNKTAKQLTKEWAEKIGCDIFTVNSKSLSDLLNDMKALCKEQKADYVIYSYNDIPFLNYSLTEEMIKSHTEYKAEYTFADGYPYGLSPEIIDAGTLGILAELSQTTQKDSGEKPVSRDSIYNLLKTDINSFDIESEIAPEDWRLYRFSFHCGKKENYLQCAALSEKLEESVISANELSEVASKTPGCLKTVPGYYNLQIADKVNSNYVYLPYEKAYEEKYKISPLKTNNFMDYSKFCALVDSINEFSENAVINLSAWGEPLLHKDCLKMIEKILSYEGLSVFVETDGIAVDENFCNQLKTIVEKTKERTNGWQKVMVAVSLDSATVETYKTLHKGATEENFSKALKAVEMLQSVIPGAVYPQFVRINENENELESFYRFWNEKTNPSNGNMIIQKYEGFAGLLPDRKPADLSPLEKLPCWHIRRDMNILSNGDVTFCRCSVLSEVVGNVFENSLEEIWHKTDAVLQEHINQKYTNKCGKCDEGYTYNF